MSIEASIEHRGRSRQRQIVPLPGLTYTGRVRRGTKGKPEHGCVFCGKVYTRREHLRRHQRKHKKGAYPCIAPGCTCTFHNPTLLDRHRRHDWCSPFELPETYLFRCPSRPEISPQSVNGRSTSATPATPSDDGIVSSSPTIACADFASSPEETFNITGLSSRSQYLQVPDWNNSHNRQSAGHSDRPMARSGYSSPAIMQSTQNDPTSSFSSGYPNAVPEYYVYYTYDGHVPRTDSATRLNPQAEDRDTVRAHQPILHHAVSIDNDSSIMDLPQSHAFPLYYEQHVEPRYSDPIPSEINSLAANTHVYSSAPMGTEHGYDAFYAFGSLDQSLQSYDAVFEGPTIASLDQHQERMSSTEYPSSSGNAHLQPTYWMARTNASRSHSTGNLDLQFLGGWSDEQR